MDMHGEAIALLDPVDGNRAALRIEEGKLQLCRRAVLFAGDTPPKASSVSTATTSPGSMVRTGFA
jgi:hypothetical protein